jgi:hypothetical protein
MGILEYINQSKPIYYTNILTKKMFENACKKAFEKSNQDRKWVIYTSELGGIELDCQIGLTLNEKHKQANQIIKLFNKLRLIRKIIQLYTLKKHHIEVGYSLLTKEEYNLRINKWFDLENDIIQQIKNTYYGTSTYRSK